MLYFTMLFDQSVTTVILKISKRQKKFLVYVEKMIFSVTAKTGRTEFVFFKQKYMIKTNCSL
jgi:hypothetical protein